MEHRHHQPGHRPVYLVFRGRVPPSAEGGTDCGVQRRDLETVQKVGRRADRGDAEPQRSAFLPGDREHSGKQRFHLYAQSGRRRPEDPGGSAEHLPGAACLA